MTVCALGHVATYRIKAKIMLGIGPNHTTFTVICQFTPQKLTSFCRVMQTWLVTFDDYCVFWVMLRPWIKAKIRSGIGPNHTIVVKFHRYLSIYSTKANKLLPSHTDIIGEIWRLCVDGPCCDPSDQSKIKVTNAKRALWVQPIYLPNKDGVWGGEPLFPSLLLPIH